METHCPYFTPFVFFILFVTSSYALIFKNTYDFHTVQNSINNATLGPAIIKDYNQKIKLKPVTFKEFRKKIHATSNRYDLLRIFFEQTDLPEDVVDHLIDAGQLQPLNYDKKPPDWIVKNPELQVHGHIHLPMQDNEDDIFELEGLEDVLSYMDELQSDPLFTCRFPQPEIFKVGHNEKSGKRYFPDCIVVYRCRNVSGCCDEPDEVCAPEKIEIFQKPFLVLKSTKNTGLVVTDTEADSLGYDKETELVSLIKQTVKWRRFINHTQCACKKIKRIDGCDKKCPVPYRRYFKNKKCRCHCRQDSTRCRAIENGYAFLKTSQLVCIKEKRCLLPKCKMGKFDIRSGRCPAILRDSARHYRNTKHIKKYRRKQKNRWTRKEKRMRMLDSKQTSEKIPKTFTLNSKHYPKKALSKEYHIHTKTYSNTRNP